ncbi:C-type lectin 1-like [Astyanax mexicanus]|uniref:C-type lectin 1-like n=1 Tax=Astyanax mexicanus TaxID=7994 RepID=A0A8T2KT46_ASTMX|nr:C-type lectin 1-like [Astyanax mexicanus]
MKHHNTEDSSFFENECLRLAVLRYLFRVLLSEVKRSQVIDILWSQCSSVSHLFRSTAHSPEKFVYYTDQKTWMEAQDFCRQRHTDLACPTNSNEELLLEKTFIYGWTWIGFFRDGWKWSDKSNSSDVRWFTDQPNNAGGKDNCGYVVKSVFSNGGTSAGLFDDGSCSNQRAFFCQYGEFSLQDLTTRLTMH